VPGRWWSASLSIYISIYINIYIYTEIDRYIYVYARTGLWVLELREELRRVAVCQEGGGQHLSLSISLYIYIYRDR